jgi:hypothetical protein
MSQPKSSRTFLDIVRENAPHIADFQERSAEWEQVLQHHPFKMERAKRLINFQLNAVHQHWHECYIEGDGFTLFKDTYELAKLAWSECWPDARMDYSLEDTYGWVSPWMHECASPEEYVVRLGRAHLETDEGCVADVDYNDSQLQRTLEVVKALEDAGVPKESIKEHLADLAHCEEAIDPPPHYDDEEGSRHRQAVIEAFWAKLVRAWV